MRTEAEKHRLILSNTHLIPMLASGYRGVKGIPFDELEGAGMVGLVEAAHDWNEKEEFVKFAHVSIKNQIRDFIRAWSAPEVFEDTERKPREFFTWSTWSDREFIYAIAEHWDDLPASPEDLAIQFEQIKHVGLAVQSAMIGFSRRDKAILNARYFSNPASSIETIARQHKISYARTVFLIDRMLNKIRNILESREAAIPSAMRG
ncbi:MAG TPA: hypothetical protein VIY48_04665 [Candidatus Paceibacterota bacterium]